MNCIEYGANASIKEGNELPSCEARRAAFHCQVSRNVHKALESMFPPPQRSLPHHSFPASTTPAPSWCSNVGNTRKMPLTRERVQQLQDHLCRKEQSLEKGLLSSNQDQEEYRQHYQRMEARIRGWVDETGWRTELSVQAIQNIQWVADPQIGQISERERSRQGDGCISQRAGGEEQTENALDVQHVPLSAKDQEFSPVKGQLEEVDRPLQMLRPTAIVVDHLCCSIEELAQLVQSQQRYLSPTKLASPITSPRTQEAKFSGNSSPYSLPSFVTGISPNENSKPALDDGSTKHPGPAGPCSSDSCNKHNIGCSPYPSFHKSGFMPSLRELYGAGTQAGDDREHSIPSAGFELSPSALVTRSRVVHARRMLFQGSAEQDGLTVFRQSSWMERVVPVLSQYD